MKTDWDYYADFANNDVHIAITSAVKNKNLNNFLNLFR